MTYFTRSHQDWENEMIENHNLQKPFAPENGNELLFNIGDDVVYTNPAGVKFNFKITGLYQPNHIDSHYALGRRYLLDWDCPWFPVEERSLEKAFIIDPRFEGIL